MEHRTVRVDLAHPVTLHVARRTPLDALPLDRLTDDERTRLARYRRVADQERFATGRTLLRAVLGAARGTDPARVRIDVAPPGPTHGRPTTPDGPDFSLAHAGDVVLVALLDGPPGARVGVDVEEVAAVVSHLDDLSDAVPAAERPTSGWSAETFTRAWVRREAVLKAVGCGLLAPRDDLVLGPADAPARVVGASGACATAHLSLTDVPDAAPSGDALVAVALAIPR
ncbi:4'-phosphopantetheinyl transferase [Sediminihabitans luteus]|uniref:4'-phosphopantetheinyl transferase n=1 Tax=Sediminihabitans luteus TaxID=1138585 RepID=A0A2M9D1A8_9CELL|nr:4'-phosphopantetheinyl transferase superfamily protein [Sediminihabitans luteus]PJJ77863.1 4'-phosphopantetheinyl transferase [Sediminihabitans luteus]GII99779.1 4'-phosphopantetheinyl transferase [Sediminihabitans luteus]